jgi:hypothetical protein
LFALALACSKSPETPVSPSAATDPSAGAAADGSTLKVTAPTAVSPVNGAQPDTLVLTTNKSTGKYDPSLAPSYEFQIRTTGGATVAGCSATVPGGSGSTVAYTPTCTLEFDTNYTWRSRAVMGTAVGPWANDAAFRSAAGGYIRDNEIFDPLSQGKTVGQVRGSVTFLPGQGARLNDHTSHVLYVLPVNLQAGELSVMILGADEGSPGDKSKVFSMQEGPDEGDITDDDYRMTAELRGRNYGAPGAVTFRIIPGDGNSYDGVREQVNFNSSRWYFWKFEWRTGFAQLTVRLDSETGPIQYQHSDGTGTHPYRPVPHYVYIGAPVGRAGPIDATLPGGIYKNLWVSSRARPTFPN